VAAGLGVSIVFKSPSLDLHTVRVLNDTTASFQRLGEVGGRAVHGAESPPKGGTCGYSFRAPLTARSKVFVFEEYEGVRREYNFVHI